MTDNPVVQPEDAAETVERIMNDAAVKRVKRMGYRIVKIERVAPGTTYEYVHWVIQNEL